MKHLRSYLFFQIVLFGLFLAGQSPALPLQSLYEPSWQWIDENGKKAGLSQYKGEAVILTMTYTSCSMSCPTTIRTLKRVSRDFEKKKIKAHFVIISFDTKNDTYLQLARYKKKWSLPENWHFLTGNEGDMAAIEKFLDFKVSYDRIDDHYSHDKKIFIIDRDGKIKKIFEDWNSDFSNALSTS